MRGKVTPQLPQTHHSHQSQRREPHRTRAFFVALAAYAVVYLAHLRPGHGPAWYLLALWIAPALIGLAAGMTMPARRGVGAAARMAALAMLVYALVALFKAHAPINSETGAAAFQVLLVIGFVAAVYAAFAAGVAAGTNALWCMARTERKPTAP